MERGAQPLRSRRAEVAAVGVGTQPHRHGIAGEPHAGDELGLSLRVDWVWFDWLFTWPPFALWMVIIAVAVLNDHNTPRMFPRWVAYYNLWSALLIVPAGLIAFFKTGPFAYDGVISFWFAVAVFFGWMVTMTVVTFRAVAVEERRQKNGAPVA